MAFLTKWSPGYRQAISASRRARALHRAELAEAERLATVPTGGREPSGGCAGDGLEHTCHQSNGSLYRPLGYWRLFCAHERPRWEPCGMCKRDKKEAARNWALHQQGLLR